MSVDDEPGPSERLSDRTVLLLDDLVCFLENYCKSVDELTYCIPELFGQEWKSSTIFFMKKLLQFRKDLITLNNLQIKTVWSCIFAADYSGMYLLLKYGLLNPRQLDAAHNFKGHSNTVEAPNVKVVFDDDDEEFGREVIELDLDSVPETQRSATMRMHKYYEASDLTPRNERKRLRFILFVIDSLVEDYALYDWETSVARKVLCVRILFEFLREPYVTTHEFEGVLKKLLDFPDHLVSEFTVLFEEYYPEKTENYVPRSLKHLSRCQVRRSLIEADMLPDGVEFLPLPDRLKSYILPDLESFVFTGNGNCARFECGSTQLWWIEASSVILEDNTVPGLIQYSENPGKSRFLKFNSRIIPKFKQNFRNIFKHRLLKAVIDKLRYIHNRRQNYREL